LKWKFFAGRDISATPAIYDGTLYFPSWDGNIYAVNKANGLLVWKQNLQKLTGINATGGVRSLNWTVSRSTPTVAGDDLMIINVYGPAVVICVKRTSGKLVWKTTLDYHPEALVTMSGTYYKGSVLYCKSIGLLSIFFIKTLSHSNLVARKTFHPPPVMNFIL